MTQIHYHISNAAQLDSKKPWVTLVHGLFGSLDNLAMLRRALDEQFNVLSVDLPDHGKSKHTDHFSFNEYAERITDLLAHLDVDQTHFVGHSLGGKISMQIALQNPELVQKLVVADIAPVKYPHRHENVFQGLKNVDLSTIESRRHAHDLLAEHIVESGTRQFLLKSLFQGEDQWNWRFNLEILERDYHLLIDAIDEQGQFHGDVLFIKGEQSDYITHEHREDIAKRFPNSKAKVIQGTGHWLHAEKPNVFNRIVGDFLLKQ